jgi:hypothetical protein
MQPKVDENGQGYLANDLSKAKLSVRADVGPSSSSRRAATVRALSAVLETTQDPQTQTILTAMIMMNMEGEGLSDVRQYFRRQLVQMGAVKPTEEEKQALAEQQANQPPDPNSSYLLAAAQNQLADAENKRKNGQLTDAKVAQTIADALSKIAGIKQGDAAHALNVVDTLGSHQLAREQMAQDAQQAAQQQAAQTAPPSSPSPSPQQ